VKSKKGLKMSEAKARGGQQAAAQTIEGEEGDGAFLCPRQFARGLSVPGESVEHSRKDSDKKSQPNSAQRRHTPEKSAIAIPQRETAGSSAIDGNEQKSTFVKWTSLRLQPFIALIREQAVFYD
jgi:hypothetical protein